MTTLGIRTLSSRRLSNLGVLVVVAAATWALHSLLSASLHRTELLSGWLLFTALVLLATYNLRKKLSFIPLGSASTWLQIHVYTGWFAVFLFVLHLGGRWPHSVLGILMTVLFLGVAGSGVVGIFISRNFASRLTTRGGEVVYERIPSLRRNLREQAENLVMKSVSETETQTIARFYTSRLKTFFHGPRNFLLHLFESGSPWSKLDHELTNVERYLQGRELEILAELRELVRAKNTLDYHHALQSVLKYWLFVHIPATFGLMLLVLAHIVLVYAFAR
jgi:hypothetical protein